MVTEITVTAKQVIPIRLREQPSGEAAELKPVYSRVIFLDDAARARAAAKRRLPSVSGPDDLTAA